MAPSHILPLRAIWVILEVKMPHSVFIKQAIGVVHPPPLGGMMIDWAILLAVGYIETIARFEFFPDHKVLDRTGGTAVIGKVNVEQHLLSLITVEGNRHEIVDVVNGYFGD